jgi:Icc-related predicted phosphoesterase
MKIVAISDLHGELPEIPQGDLVLIGGDICPVSNHSVEFQWNYLGQNFNNWVNKIDAPVVWIGGNHDFVLEQYPTAHEDVENATYLQDHTIRLNDLKIHGSPWTPQFFDWAFMKNDDDLAENWTMIPDDVDILITHGPPHGCLDLTQRGVNAGSKTLSNRLTELTNLKLHVFGHIHEAFGVFATKDCTYTNVAHVDRSYEPRKERTVIEL